MTARPRPAPDAPPTGTLTTVSTVLALIPHHECEEWLAGCLDSMERQSRPLDGIVVLDDASGPPPVEIVERFPNVTLMKARNDENVGPYRLVQQAIDDHPYDAYMFQDADDWSSEDRLERLLERAAASGAELVGSQEVRVLCGQGDVVTFSYPLDVNRALLGAPSSFPLLHPTSLVSRALVQRLGGFATGLRFGGDAEFLRRAGYVATLANVAELCYFRRIRTGSLTTSSTTGMQSPARRDLMAELHARARENADAAAEGRPPVLTPYKVAGPIRLEHIAGPALLGAHQAARHEEPIR